MKLNAFIAAALVATSSAAFAGIDNGSAEATMDGGELVLVAWDDVQKKSILFDTGVTFKQLVDNKAALAPTIVNLAAIDSSYKSFFNNDFSNVSWNAYVASNTSNGGTYDSKQYYGVMHTTVDVDGAMALPKSGNELIAAMNNYGDTMELFVENFAAGGQDLTADSVNLSYRQSSASDPAYLGDLGTKWGTPMGGMNAIATAALAGQKIMMVWANVADLTFGDGETTKFANAVFDPTTDTFRVNTPLPAAAWLLMSGIAGFGAIARRRKQQA